ncbi:NUDIX domain-containing protein [Mycoplasma struthionis]|uniref:NUDIX domain-containing protein n=1 Tax=Mycoplasma struthionis TaxID=538220 RepID=A0A3G8LIJ0_9MOLU|nr:NUDIX domain-containing protein [Mycoplasma struthionis]AZG68478.1 NUDIX domain-containing protein [Mycoplasma struthionis]TPI02641.1 NUDIX domain-containing protein [Mycoplasma struthionis]
MTSKKYITLHKTEQGLVYAQRAGKNSIAALCYRINENNEKEFLIHYQILIGIKENQNWNDQFPCPITGSLDHENEDTVDTAIREVAEEGGFIVNKNNLKISSSYFSSTQLNEIVYCYIFDVTNLKENIPSTDGSFYEQLSYNKWLKEAELIELLKNGPHLASLSFCYNLTKEIKN